MMEADYYFFILYAVFGFCLSLGIFYFFYDIHQKRELLRRRREIRRANQRLPQKRRDDAVYRNNEIRRKIKEKIQNYIQSPAMKRSQKSFQFQWTNNGKIYGQYVDVVTNDEEDETNEKQK